LDLIEEGQPIIECNVPTAGGKSGIIYTTMLYLHEERDFDYLTYTSPQVQLVSDQLRKQFPDLPVLVGKGNYQCLVEPQMTAADCPFSMSEDGFIQCAMCPYRIDYRTFIESPYGATTFDRYLSDPSINGRCRGLFIDESATTEDKLLNRVDMLIPPEVDVDDLQNGLTIYYHKLVVEADRLEKEINELKGEAKKGNRKAMVELTDVTKKYNHVSREARKCARCLGFLDRHVPYIIDENKHFRLIQGKALFEDMIKKLQFVVLASGTPTTALLTSNYKSVSTPNLIDVERRLIYYDPHAPGTKAVMKMNYQDREKWAPHMALKIAQYHAKYAIGKHTLVHCGTYGVAGLIYDAFEKHAFAHHPLVPMDLFNNIVLQEKGAIGRDRTMAKWIAGSNTIYLGVERNEGISCDGPEFPLNIVANVFYPPYKDPWINARNAFDGKLWYNTGIAVDVTQACSRCTRGPEDFSTTVIMDGKFSGHFGQNRMLYPPYFREALRTI
jgi:Rad3-related DNA helicase